MKKRVVYIAIILFVGSFLVIVISISNKMIRHNNLQKSIQLMPDFSFKTLNGQIFNSDSIRSGPVLIVYYHPECEHCRYEINELFNYRQKISGTHVLLISFAHPDSIIAFFGERIGEINDINLLVDDSLKFSNYFSSNVIPSTFIYDDKKKLKRFYKGEVKPETIIEAIMSND